MIPRDLLWKDIIESFFDEFLRFFFPGLVPLIDFERPFEFLDKDLAKLYPESKRKQRHADKLVKVYLLDGKEVWVLIHIEVQGYTDHDFAKRMFTMFYRLWERHAVQIEQLAIYTDDSPTFHPKGFRYRAHGTWFDYGFKSWKLLDRPPETYSGVKNVFSLVMETAWYGLGKNKVGDEQLLSLKFSIMKKFLEEGMPRNRIIQFFDFVSYYVNFENKVFIDKFEEQILKNADDMSVREIAKEIRAKRAFEKGEEKGEEKGIAKGMELSILKLLKNGFTPEMTAQLLEVELKTVLGIQQQFKKDDNSPKS